MNADVGSIKKWVLLRDHTQGVERISIKPREEVLKMSGIRATGRQIHGMDEYVKASSEAEIRKWIRMYTRRDLPGAS